MASTPRTTLTFLGGAGTVTGSKFLLTVGDRRVLIDSGLFQGEKKVRQLNWEEFPVAPASISDVVLTHAHLDHVGYLPALTKHGFSGPVWCTGSTQELAEIVLRDSAYLQELDAAEANERGFSKHSPALPLYTIEDVEAVLPQFVSIDFDTDIPLLAEGNEVTPGEEVTVRFTRAGHILGSASVNAWTGSASVLFSGDLGRHDHPVLRPRDIPPGAPYVLMESTYGDREHPEPENLPHEAFADVIRRTIERGGTVLVPAFAIDRTEVVLQTISALEREGRIPDVPVYVNSPMGVRALRVYQSHPEELGQDLHPEDLVNIPDLTTVESTEDSRKLTGPGGHGPCIIISSSGMATGGRVLHHLAALLPDPKNAVVLTGYQGVGTRGRQLSDGDEEIKIHGQYVSVRAEVVHDREFSVHADGSDLIDWLGELDPAPQQIFCVHGDQEPAEALTTRIGAELGLPAVVPSLGEVILLDAGSDAPPAPVRRGKTAPTTPDSEKTTPRAAAPETPKPGDGSATTGLRYRLLTGPDEAALSRRVSEALHQGYHLHDRPTLTVDGGTLIASQAVIWPPESGDPPQD
ncbi:MAG: MBL fold metallo-hydrolase RNA specificity domain-containing protein [Propioniciclava sp.]